MNTRNHFIIDGEMIRVIEKFWQGTLADTLDYRVIECIEKDMNMLVIYERDGEYMRLTPKMMKYEKLDSRPARSKHDGRPHNLWSYRWRPLDHVYPKIPRKKLKDYIEEP